MQARQQFSERYYDVSTTEDEIWSGKWVTCKLNVFEKCLIVTYVFVTGICIFSPAPMMHHEPKMTVVTANDLWKEKCTWNSSISLKIAVYSQECKHPVILMKLSRLWWTLASVVDGETCFRNEISWLAFDVLTIVVFRGESMIKWTCTD